MSVFTCACIRVHVLSASAGLSVTKITQNVKKMILTDIFSTC